MDQLTVPLSACASQLRCKLHAACPCPPPGPQVLAALGLAGSAVISYGLALVVQVSPWYDPQASRSGRAVVLGHSMEGPAARCGG